MTYVPLLLFIGIPVCIVMIGKHPVLKQKLIALITKMERGGNLRKFLSYITISLIIGVTTDDFIFVNLLAGYLYGPLKGAFIASSIYGMSLVIGGFIKSKDITKTVIEIENMDDVIHKIYEVKDSLTVAETTELVVLSRLSPIVPDSFITMMWRTTNISNYILYSASILGNLPQCIIYTYFGSLIHNPKHILSHKYSMKYEYIMICSLMGVVITYGSHEMARYLIAHHRAIFNSPS